MTPLEHYEEAGRLLADVKVRTEKAMVLIGEMESAKEPQESITSVINMVNIGLQASSTRALAHATLANAPLEQIEVRST